MGITCPALTIRLCLRHMMSRRPLLTCTSHLPAFPPAVAAAESRDALAKTLYARLFDWLVGQINKKINSLGSGAGAAGGGWW